MTYAKIVRQAKENNLEVYSEVKSLVGEISSLVDLFIKQHTEGRINNPLQAGKELLLRISTFNDINQDGITDNIFSLRPKWQSSVFANLSETDRQAIELEDFKIENAWNSLKIDQVIEYLRRIKKIANDITKFFNSAIRYLEETNPLVQINSERVSYVSKNTISFDLIIRSEFKSLGCDELQIVYLDSFIFKINTDDALPQLPVEFHSVDCMSLFISLLEK